jgi:hypothetical protein
LAPILKDDVCFYNLSRLKVIDITIIQKNNLKKPCIIALRFGKKYKVSKKIKIPFSSVHIEYNNYSYPEYLQKD